MAEDLRFGITFDVQSAAEKAKADLPSLIKDLQTMLNSKPLAINLDLDKDYNKTFFDTGPLPDRESDRHSHPGAYSEERIVV